jgi:hypothetical protein
MSASNRTSVQVLLSGWSWPLVTVRAPPDNGSRQQSHPKTSMASTSPAREHEWYLYNAPRAYRLASLSGGVEAPHPQDVQRCLIETGVTAAAGNRHTGDAALRCYLDAEHDRALFAEAA